MRERGFSLIEACIALIIVGLMLGPLLYNYSLDIRQNEVEITNANLMTIKSALGNYYQQHGYYPPPAKLTLNFDDNDYGESIDITTTDLPPANQCSSDGICHWDGLADMLDSDETVPNDPPLGDTVKQVITGAVPFKNLLIPATKSVDAWNRKIIYAVSKDLVDVTIPFDQKAAAISLVDSNGNAVVRSGENFPHVVLVSAGRNGIGAYTISGERIEGCEGSPDEENCDGDDVYGDGLSDDFHMIINRVPVGFWTYTAPNSDFIWNTNEGRIGVGTDRPSEIDIDNDGTPETDIKMDVAGNIGASRARAQSFCDQSGTNCFDARIIAGRNPSTTDPDDPEGSEHHGYIDCASGLLSGIVNGNQKCYTPVVINPVTCSPGEIITHFDSSGNPVCE